MNTPSVRGTPWAERKKESESSKAGKNALCRVFTEILKNWEEIRHGLDITDARLDVDNKIARIRLDRGSRLKYGGLITMYVDPRRVTAEEADTTLIRLEADDLGLCEIIAVKNQPLSESAESNSGQNDVWRSEIRDAFIRALGGPKEAPDVQE